MERIAAGDPDDGLTALDYYVLSGVFGVDGNIQAGQLVAVYYESANGGYDLVTATLTDEDGKFAVKVYDEGNYRICPYVSSEVYEVRNVSVGYQEERPSVGTAINGSYTVSGTEDYQSLTLYKIAGSVETAVHEESGANASSYEIKNLDAGEYRLKLVNGGRETWYYFTCPEGTLVDVTYFVTISGSVTDEDGKAVIGANVAVYDGEGNQAGEAKTILSDGRYAWTGLPEGKYEVVVTSPNTSSVMADKWTYEQDSYGTAYEGGIAANGAWVWNINAHMVSGKVTDQNGEPIANAYVKFASASDPESSYVAITGEDGGYVIGLAPDGYDAGAVCYWDEAHAYGGTGTVHLELERDTAGVDFTITRHALAVEAVRAADGMAAPGAEIEVRLEDGTLYWTGCADEAGKASLTVFPGSYRISGKYDGSEEVTVSETVTGDAKVVLRLDSVVYITGTVRDGDGNAVPDGLVHYVSGSNSGYVYTGDDGSYSIAVGSGDLGEYEIYAARGTETGEKVTISVHTDVEADLTVGGNSETPDTDHVISGVVTDENGSRLANALVTMTWGNDKANSSTTSTNSRGEYGFTVPDGTYYLTAACEADNGSRYETNSESVVHVNGADAAKDLVILVGYEVEVTVVDAGGNTVAGASVRYTGAASGEVQTGSDGTASLHLPKGEYQFWAKTAGRTSPMAELTVSGQASLTLELENAGIFYEEPDLSDNGLTVWGWVYDPKGEPVPGADVELYRQDQETLEWAKADSTLADGGGRYEFPEMDSGVYRVDTAYTRVADAGVSEAGYVVSGTVADEYGDPLSNCRVELWTEAGGLVAEVMTDDDGAYVFESADPDESYAVKAWDATGEPVLDEPAAVTATSTIVSGTVLDVAGNIVAGAEVVIRDAGGSAVVTTVTDETGYYSIAIDSRSDGYQVETRYPASYELDTDSYERDTTDRNSPYLEPSWYTVKGYVHDNDGELVEGAAVILTNASGEELDRYVTEADGYYVFDHLEDGVYYVRVMGKDGAEQVYRVEAGDSSDNIHVSVTNYSKGAVIEPASGWYDGWNSFTVECGLACVVYVDDGGGMTKLEAEATDDNGVYRFTANLSEDDGIVVIVRGDVDLDGKLTTADLVCLSQYFGGGYELSGYSGLAADVDQDGRLTTADLVCLSQYFGGGYVMDW